MQKSGTDFNGMINQDKYGKGKEYIQERYTKWSDAVRRIKKQCERTPIRKRESKKIRRLQTTKSKITEECRTQHL